MLGLRYFSCDRCGLVHSNLDEPARCARCDGDDFTPVVADRERDALGGDVAYFAGSMIDER
ncbi:hypothetical protein GRX01_18255 [Halobaculum sp. WSA2]|uniref:Rubredoxin-like domain-containing protein n=1 Tax=Halobaculum saliterrae TaxID=2073113 RepID=A0A6B0SW51_9EURY|nr:hypothetical protein [Halobaculum saliterrae]MXR43268.1 hypothetical protein [Halobaculum saliterrae]